MDSASSPANFTPPTSSTSATARNRALTATRLDTLFLSRDTTGAINMADAKSIAANQKTRKQDRDFVKDFDTVFQQLGPS
jgi:hypothetical protein